ncbi:MAG: putative GTP-binding protein, partial [Deltaproteobacteria bacterium]|nr:putative GTP-binding protein [Deltaproteobacteria bacterium]
GYIALEHVILATTKGYAHRLYIGKGIHADLTLMFNNGSFRALEWTYPDYAEPETIALFNKWRESVKQALKEFRRGPVKL